MDLSTIADVATIAEAIFVTISVIFIWVQLRQSVRLTNAANTQALVELSSPFNLLLSQDRELAQLWLRGSKQFAEMDEVDKTRYRFLLFHSLTLQENIYCQHENGLLSPAAYESWRRSFESFAKEHNLGLHWPDIKDYYQEGFATYLQSLIESGNAR